MVDKTVIDTIIAEAGGNDPKAMAAVAAVINNRAQQLGVTPAEVVKQPHQFEGYSNPGHASRSAQKMSSVRAKAERAWTGITTGQIADPTNGGTMFHAASVTPYWADSANKNGTVKINGQVYYKGNAPSSAVAAIDAVAPVPRSIPTSLSAYADTPAVALPPLPIPRPNYPTGGSATLLPFAGGLTAQPQGAGDSWGPESGRWGPSNFANAFPPSAPHAPSEALTSRSVHTVQIDPFTGNPVGSNAPFVSADHPLSNAVAPKTIYYNSTAGNVALPKGVVPASVTRDLASIAAQQMNRSGSPDDRQASAPQIAPTPLPARPSALNAPYVPGPNGFTVANKDASQLGGGSPSLPFAYGEPAPTAPSVAAIQSVLKPTTTYSYKQMQESNPLYEKYIAAQGADDIGAGPGSFADLQNALAPSRYITRSVRVPTTTYTRVPLPQPRPAIPQPRATGGLLGLLFPGTNPAALSMIGQGFGGAPSAPLPAPGASFLAARDVPTAGLNISQMANELNKQMAGSSHNADGSRGFGVA